MSGLLDEIRGEIERRGPLTVARYMELALYHERHGYYSSGARRTGRGGHFLTSAELDPAFGALWSGELAAVWDDCGRPERFVVIEVGPGEGGFARALVDGASGAFARALHLHLVEPVPALRARQSERLGDAERATWSDAVGDVPRVAHGAVFVNEVLDNLPVHVVDGAEEVYVDVADDGLIERRAPYSAPVASLLERSLIEVPAGVRAEVPVAAVGFVRTCAAGIDKGALFFVDYGDEWEGLLERPGGTLVCYRSGGADDLYLERPGEKDITAHANWSVVGDELRASGNTVTGPLPQRQVLEKLGLARLHERLRREIAAANDAGDGRRAVRAMSRRGALGALADPGGLGNLGVVAGAKGIPARLAP